MGSKVELSLHLEKKQLEWLETMAKKYNLPSAGKALRICIVYTKQANDDASIFAKVGINTLTLTVCRDWQESLQGPCLSGV